MPDETIFPDTECGLPALPPIPRKLLPDCGVPAGLGLSEGLILEAGRPVPRRCVEGQLALPWYRDGRYLVARTQETCSDDGALVPIRGADARIDVCCDGGAPSSSMGVSVGSEGDAPPSVPCVPPARVCVRPIGCSYLAGGPPSTITNVKVDLYRAGVLVGTCTNSTGLPVCCLTYTYSGRYTITVTQLGPFVNYKPASVTLDLPSPCKDVNVSLWMPLIQRKVSARTTYCDEGPLNLQGVEVDFGGVATATTDVNGHAEVLIDGEITGPFVITGSYTCDGLPASVAQTVVLEKTNCSEQFVLLTFRNKDGYACCPALRPTIPSNPASLLRKNLVLIDKYGSHPVTNLACGFTISPTVFEPSMKVLPVWEPGDPLPYGPDCGPVVGGGVRISYAVTFDSQAGLVWIKKSTTQICNECPGWPAVPCCDGPPGAIHCTYSFSDQHDVYVTVTEEHSVPYDRCGVLNASVTFNAPTWSTSTTSGPATLSGWSDTVLLVEAT